YRCQNEDCFKHDRKIVPIGHHVIHERYLVENMCHTYSQRHCSSCPAMQVHTDHFTKMIQIHRQEMRMLCDKGVIHFLRSIDCKIITWNQRTCCDKCHQGNKSFHQHSTIAH